jgi:hypothetical protein
MEALLKALGAHLSIREDAEVGTDGSAQIFLRPLEGCYSRAPTLHQARLKAPAKVHGFLDWLRTRGETVPGELWKAPIGECEVIHGDWPVDMGDSVALFDCDKEPMTKDEVEGHLRWMSHSWDDFLGLLERVPHDAWDWKLPGQLRTIRQIVVHIALVTV